MERNYGCQLEALGEAATELPHQEPTVAPALTPADGVLGCMRVVLTLLTISWLRGEMSAVYENEGAPQ